MPTRQEIAMKIRFGKQLYIYFVVSMLTILSMLTIGAYMYWSRGAANIDGVAQVFESSVELESIKKKGGPEKIETLIKSDRVREAISYFEDLNSRTTGLNNIENIEEYQSLEKSAKKMKSSLNGLLSAPARSAIINVFRTKVISFKDFVIQNNWRTLTRVSRKIETKISSTATRSPDFFTYAKMSKMYDSLNSDLTYMENVTKGSILAREDKNLILIKIDNLRSELSMLSRSLGAVKKFRISNKEYQKDFNTWFSAIGPTLSLKKINIVKNSQYILYAMIFCIAIVSLLTISGYFVYVSGGRKQKVEVEKAILDVVKEGLIPVKAKLDNSWSVDFKEDVDKFREYIHKRMSFGSIFQDAMPFSSILLDSNLNLVWANSLFYEHWSLDKNIKNKNSVTWDSLQRFTNLGDNDPVITAAQENIAGIYQIQVKTESLEEAAPFEMYVSPVEYAGQKRIMVIFYPLRSLEETLGNQMKSLVSPVSKTLDALLDNKFRGEFIERVQQDFEAAGIETIFKKFCDINDFYNQQRTGLLSEIEQLETTLFDQYNVMDEIKITLEGQKEMQVDAVTKFSSAKEHIISVVDMRSQFEHMVTEMTKLGEELFEEELSLLSKASDVNEMMTENTKAMESLVKSRDDFKKLKSQVEMFRSRVSHILEASRNSDNANKGVQGIQRLKTELMDFENVLTSFSRVATSLDVGLSKIQIIMQNKQLPDVSHTKESFERLRSSMETISVSAGRLSRIGQEKDEELIKSLKGLYLGFQNLRAKSKEIDEMYFTPQSLADELAEEIATTEEVTTENIQEVGPA
jgi:hypothetical protein